MTVSPIGRPCTTDACRVIACDDFNDISGSMNDSIVAWDRRRSYTNALSLRSSRSYGGFGHPWMQPEVSSCYPASILIFHTATSFVPVRPTNRAAALERACRRSFRR